MLNESSTAAEKKLKNIINGAVDERNRNKELIHAIFKTTPDCIFIKDLDMRYTLVNPAMELIFQQPASELKGKTDEYLFGDELGKHIKEIDSRVLSGATTREEYTQPVNEVITTLNIVKIPIRNNSGKIKGIFGIARDLTEHKKTEESLRENKELFQTVINSTDLMTFTLDKEQKYTGVFGRWIENLGLTPEDFIGKKVQDVLGDDAVIHEIANERALKGEDAVYEWSVESPEEPRHYQIHLSTLKNPLGETTGIVGVGYDTTEHKKIKKKLLRSEKRFNELTKILPEIVYETDEEGNISFANHRAFKTLKYTQKDLDEGLNILQILTPRDQKEAKTAIQKVLRGEKLRDCEYTARRKDGTSFPALMHLTPLIYENKPVGLRGIIVDITDRRNVEATLRESEEKYKRIFELSPEAVVLLDLKGNFLDMNNRICELTGYRAEEIIGKNLLNLPFIPKKGKAKILKNFSRRLLGKETPPYEIDFISRNGEKINGMITATPLRDKNGKIIGDLAIISDITDRKKAEERLKTSYKANKDIIENAPFGIYVISEEGNIDYVNPKMVEISGDTYEQFKNLNVFDLPTYGVIGLQEKIMSGLKGKYFKEDSVEYTSYYSKKITVRNFTGVPLEEEGKKKVLMIVEDITDRKKAEEEIRQRTEDISLINLLNISANRGESTAKILHILTEETKRIFSCFGATIYFVSKNKKQLILPRKHMPRSIDNLMVKTIGRKVGTKTRNAVVIPLKEGGLYKQIIQDPKPHLINDPKEIRLFMKELAHNRELEKHILTIHNTLGIGSMIHAPLFSEGECIGIMEISRKKAFTDSDLQRLSFIAENLTLIINRKLAEEALETSRASFHSIVEKNADSILVIDSGGRMCYVNPSVEHIFDRRKEELIGESFKYPVAAGESTEIDITRGCGGAGIGEMRVVETLWGGEPAYLTTIRDITDRKKAEGVMEKQVEELRKLDEAKTEFISIAGHELKTPLQSLILANDILLNEPKLGARQKKYLEVMQGDSVRLRRLINNLLNLSALQLGKIEFDIVAVGVKKLLSDVWDEMSLKAGEKNIKLIVEACNDSLTVSGDKDGLNQVLANLIGNAIKFTPEKGIITLSAEEIKDEVRVCVKDTGPGIPEDMQEKLFHRFFQARPLINKREGFGLGLAISKEIVEAHNGRIWCESGGERGSKFFFTLPKKRGDVDG